MSPNAKDTNMLVSFAIGDTKVPNVNGFALQWNIGLRLYLQYKWIFFSHAIWRGSIPEMNMKRQEIQKYFFVS